MNAPAAVDRPLRPSWRAIGAVAVALLVAAVALGQLQALLAGMHLSGRPGSSIGGLNHLFHLGADRKTTASAVQVWKEYADATAGQPTAGPREVAWWAVAIDFFLLAPLYTTGLVLLLWRARRQLERWRDTPDAGARKRLAQRTLARDTPEDLRVSLGVYRNLALAGVGLILLGFLADEVENALSAAIVEYGFGARPDFASTAFGALTWALWVAAWVKWVAGLATVVIALLLVWVVFAEGRKEVAARWATARSRLHLLRLQAILVAVVAVAPFAHEQIPDLIRRWTPAQLALTVLLTWAFALATWLIGRRLLVLGQWRPDAATRRLIARVLFVGVLALAALQGVAHVLSTGRYRPGWGLAVPAVILAALALLGWLLPRGVGLRGDPPGQPLAATEKAPGLPRALAAITVGAFGLGILEASFGYSVYARTWSRHASPLVALGLVAAGVGLAAALRRELLLGGAAGALAGVIVLRIAERRTLDPPVLVASGLLLVLAGWRLYGALDRPHLGSPKRPLPTPLVAAIGAGFAAAYGLVVAFPLDVGERIGGVGILLFSCLLFTCAAGLLVWVNPALHVPRALRVARFAQFPLVTLIVVWFLAASYIDPGGYHDVRLETAAAPARGVTLEEAWGCWLAKNGLGARNPTCAPGRAAARAAGATPLILVATTGGGIRAAYWTSLVLDCAFEVVGRDCPTGAHSAGFAASDRLFALSGISGGSLGLVSYAAYLSGKSDGRTDADWVRDRLHGDALSGSVAWWSLVELPRAFLQFRSPTDRAAILERGWERQWPHRELSRGLLDLARRDRHQPLLLLNGTSVEDGCRFETSPLNGNVETAAGVPPGCKSTEPFDASPPDVSPSSVLPATRDLLDYLCDDRKDVRLSTAALLSGRFPFVNPSARVDGRCRYGDAKAPVAYVVDGGYLDTSGASPIVELMARLGPLVDRWNAAHAAAARCVVPVMIQIDNGFAEGLPRPPRRPPELLVPLRTLFATRGAREAEGRVEAALLFAGANGGGDRYARFVNEAHPGPHAPLGWTQSRVSEDELVAQLKQARNAAAFEEVRRWLRPGALRCPAGA